MLVILLSVLILPLSANVYWRNGISNDYDSDGFPYEYLSAADSEADMMRRLYESRWMHRNGLLPQREKCVIENGKVIGCGKSRPFTEEDQQALQKYNLMIGAFHSSQHPLGQSPFYPEFPDLCGC